MVNSNEVIDGLNLDYGQSGIFEIFNDMEGLGGDLGLIWDPRDSQDLGPIPTFIPFYPSNINESLSEAPSCHRNALVSYPSNINELLHSAPSCNPIGLNAIEPEQQEYLDCLVIANNTLHDYGASSSRQNVVSPDTSASQPPSPSSVLESSGKYSSGRSLPIAFKRVRARSKRGVRRPLMVNPWFLKTPIVCAASVSKKNSDSVEEKMRPRTPPGLSNALERPKGPYQRVMKSLPEDVNYTEKKVTSKLRYGGSKRRYVEGNRCTHCHVTKTPQWREGPLGKNTLCNACGVRYRSGRLLPEYRPAASPTFTPSLHSNSHRKVIEMRGKGEATEEVILVENPMSSLSESVPMSNYLFHEAMFPSLHSNSHRKVIEMRGKGEAVEETVLVENPMSLLSESVSISNILLHEVMFSKC